MESLLGHTGGLGMNDQNQVGGLGTTLETAIIFTTDMDALANFYKEGLDLGDFERSPARCMEYCPWQMLFYIHHSHE